MRGLIGMKFRTKYPSIVRKGSVGVCVINGGHELKIRFNDSEEFYFYKRDLEKMEEETHDR